MAAVMKHIAAGSAAATLAVALLYRYTGEALLLTLTITFAATAYHFNMRLLMGAVINGLLHNRVDYRRGWFQLRPFEKRVYEVWQVKRWKHWLPTYDPSLFSLKLHTPEEIVQAMCQAEIVHEIIAALSFLPLLAARWLGAAPVFLITGLLAAGFDLLFVIVQRYNRPRMLRLVGKQGAAFCKAVEKP